MEDGYLRVDDVASFLSMGVSTIWTKSKKNEDGFPSGRKITDRITVWKKSELEDWVNRNTVDVTE
ncbi:MAG: AlpA family phage regulatory protein [Proteobacteria bacterium]|jgi:predicted DNA-binding transcriptional regulator AlpA|nr:AlpA family phage regulatory protein [Pseudomonadota bacterium]|tara:strand:- start:462 stop:656 length:195 start_codon:yes stop_codon:yes gene_type:complete